MPITGIDRYSWRRPSGFYTRSAGVCV